MQIDPHRNPLTPAADQTPLDSASLPAIPKAAEMIPMAGLSGYIQQFGIDIRTLDNYQIGLFALAKQMKPFVDTLRVNTSSISSEEQKRIWVEHEVEKQIPRTAYREGAQTSPIPADSMNVSPLTETGQIASILPAEWLLDDVAPELFTKKLLNRELLRAEWQENVRTPVTEYSTVKVREMIEVPAPPQEKRHHAAVLFDRSESMDDDDRRGEVAKGLALSFLKSAFDDRSLLHLRTFNASVGSPVAGRDLTTLTSLAKSLVQLRFSGGTDIQSALNTGFADIQADSQHEASDLLLITDGLSTLDRRPHGATKIHTVRIAPAGILGAFSIHSSDRADLDKLKAWSETYNELDPRDFLASFRPDQNQIDELLEAGRALPDRVARCRTRNELKEIAREIDCYIKEIGACLAHSRTTNEQLQKLQWKLEALRETIRDPGELAKLRKEQAEREAAAIAQQQAAEMARQREAQEKARQALSELQSRMSPNTPPQSQNPQPSPKSWFRILQEWATNAVAAIRSSLSK